MDYNLLNRKILEVFKECNIHSFPIDCVSILRKYGIRIITYQEVQKENPLLYSAISQYSKDAFRFRSSVYYNALNNKQRIRFSLMHELGHILLGHQEEISRNETEADLFASYILAPRSVVRHEKLKTADEIHDYFNISYAASNCVISDMKHWCPQPIDNQILRFVTMPEKKNELIAEFDRILSVIENSNPNLIFERAEYF